MKVPIGKLREVQEGETIGEYIFEKEYQSSTKGKVKIYAKVELGTPMILDPETFYPVRPMTPILLKRRIAVLENGRIEEFPMVIMPNQNVQCLRDLDDLGVNDSRYVWVKI